jgi:hypothetical protein
MSNTLNDLNSDMEKVMRMLKADPKAKRMFRTDLEFLAKTAAELRGSMHRHLTMNGKDY